MANLTVKFCIIAAFCIVFSESISIQDYCDINNQTTPCLTGCTRAENCGDTGDTYVPLTNEQRQLVLDTHNAFREGVAAGNYTSSYLPSSKGGIKALIYSIELEFLAACWVNQCKFAHDSFRFNHLNEKVGQNLHQTYSSALIGFPADFIPNGIGRWFNEKSLLTEADRNLTSLFYSKKGTGHLTAVIWGETEQVGCAEMHYMQESKTKPGQMVNAYNLYCNYYPSGNWIGKPVYVDKPCEVFSEKWPHLCGVDRPLEEDLNEGREWFQLDVGGDGNMVSSAKEEKILGVSGLLLSSILISKFNL